MATIDLKDLGIFSENLAELQIKEVEVPRNIKIPNWPKAAGSVRIKLGKRDCIYPVPSGETGMLYLVSNRLKLTFFVYADGSFSFLVGNAFRSTNCKRSYSTSNSNLSRIQAFMFFHQFKGEIFLKIIQKLKADLGNHNQVVAMVEKVIEPFVPFLVADQLSS